MITVVERVDAVATEQVTGWYCRCSTRPRRSCRLLPAPYPFGRLPTIGRPANDFRQSMISVRSRCGAGVGARPGHGRSCPAVLPHPWTYAAHAYAPRRDAHLRDRARPRPRAHVLPGRSRDLPSVPLVAIGRGNRRSSANSSRRRTSAGLRPRRPWPRGCPSHPAGRRRSSQHRLHGTGASWPSRDGVALSQGAAPDDLPSCPWDLVDDEASTLLTSATTASRTNSRFPA
jgi:hypothetical protein